MTDNLPKLSGGQPLEYLETITRRDFDLELFADQIESGFMVSAPRDLEASILKKAAGPDVQLEVKTRELSRKAQLLFYSFKVGTAVLGALLLLSVAPKLTEPSPLPPGYRHEMRMQETGHKIREQSKRINGFFQQFSNDFFQNGGI